MSNAPAQPAHARRSIRSAGRRGAILIAIALGAACSRPARDDAPAAQARVRLWHTFNPAETAELNQTLTHWTGGAVESSMAPFGLGLAILRRDLAQGRDCPDLVRVDATWLPGLVRDQLLAPVPADVAAQRDFLPEAVDLASVDGALYGLPQAMDGLAILYREQAVTGHAWPPATMDDLVATARALTSGNEYGLGLRVDGYWFVPFLRAWGPGMLPNAGASLGPAREPVRLGIDTPEAAAALTRFASLFGPGGVAPPPSPPDNVDSDEIRRFRAGELALVINGPWAVAGLTGGDTAGVDPGLGVAALPGAPRGGHSWAVPRCARQPSDAFALALFLTAPERQAAWARRIGVIPTTRAGLQQSDDFVRRFHAALAQATPLPRHPITPSLFDDLSPAVAAVVSGNAQPAEALAGVARAWRRLLESQGFAVAPAADAPAAQTPATGASPAGAPAAQEPPP
ncbi:MAG TPA: extracellular solute-binding protein [Haliangium sp.]|nr:extracellular solute-binding protein [Haliangium sp.]